jgi:hypothetical protein
MLSKNYGVQLNERGKLLDVLEKMSQRKLEISSVCAPSEVCKHRGAIAFQAEKGRTD